jgi:hypothetical protein
MVLMRKMLEKVAIPPAAAPTEFPPPIFSDAASVFVFLCFCGALLQITLGGHIYSGFRLKHLSSRKNQADWAIDG